MALKITSLFIVGGILVSTSAAIGQTEKKILSSGEPCRAACEADLRAKGLWNQRPYGTCKKKCGMPLSSAEKCRAACEEEWMAKGQMPKGTCSKKCGL